MANDFNQFANGRFARTQPREWKDLPWAGEKKLGREVLRVVGMALFWAGLLGLSLWSISQSVQK